MLQKLVVWIFGEIIAVGIGVAICIALFDLLVANLAMYEKTGKW